MPSFTRKGIFSDKLLLSPARHAHHFEGRSPLSLVVPKKQRILSGRIRREIQLLTNLMQDRVERFGHRNQIPSYRK
jgi:hypothetical protein